MNRIFGISAVLALSGVVACNGGGTEDSGEVTCTNSVEEVFPADGTTNAYYRTVVDVRLDDPDSAATITVTAGGSEVAGSVSVSDDHVVFTPDAPLASATAHEVTISFGGAECPDVTTSFTTSEVGSAIGDPNSLVGNAYDLDLASGRFVEPEGIGSLLGEYIGDVTLFLSVEAASSTAITMVGALGNDAGDGQSVCDPTIAFPEADFTGNPYFEVDGTGQTTSITVEGITVAIDDLKVSGAFAPDGSYIAGGVLAGSIDTRPLVDLVEEGGAPEAICDLAASIGVECEDCGGGEVYCLSLYVDNLNAQQATGVTVTATPDPYDPCVDHALECPDDCPA